LGGSLLQVLLWWPASLLKAVGRIPGFHSLSSKINRRKNLFGGCLSGVPQLAVSVSHWKGEACILEVIAVTMGTHYCDLCGQVTCPSCAQFHSNIDR
jgi:hypothetical protein